MFLYFCSFLFIFVYFCSFLFIFVHFCSFLFIFVHFCSFLFIFAHFCSFLFIFAHFCSFLYFIENTWQVLSFLKTWLYLDYSYNDFYTPLIDTLDHITYVSFSNIFLLNNNHMQSLHYVLVFYYFKIVFVF